MKSILWGVSAAAILAATSASAADLPSRKYAPEAPVAYMPAFTWNGFYAGLNGGYAWADVKSPYSFFATSGALPPFPGGFLPYRAKDSQSGFTGGIQAGYNFQYSQFVFGIEGDINYVGGSGKKNFAAIDSANDQSLTATNKGELNWLGTLRARAGFAADRALIYATGGLAFGGVKSNTSLAYFENATFTNPVALAWAGDKSETSVGWALGAGAEYAFTNNWTAKIEYLYFDLGNINYTLTDINRIGFTANIKQELTGNLVRVGVNYKF